MRWGLGIKTDDNLMQHILRTIELICLAPSLDQTESAMADLTGPRKINFVCMKLYMQVRI